MPALTADMARELAQEEVKSISASTGIALVLSESMAETKTGWVFFYNSQRFIETGNFSFALGGNGPIFIARDGTIRHLGTAQVWQHEFPEICPQCWSAVDVDLGQRVLPGDRLTWSRSIRCGACGAATEEDGCGVPPAGIREFFLQKDGIWHALLCDPSHKVLAVGVLRKLFELDMRAAAALLRSPSMELWRGTQGECDWVSKHLQRIGIEAAVQPLQDAAEHGS